MSRARKQSSVAGSLGCWLFQFVLPLLVVGGLLAGVISLGRLARDDLRRRGDLTLAFADITCAPPEGMTREEFLKESQYLAGLPDRLDPHDSSTASRVRSALAAHPWVESVKGVRVSSKEVIADLNYRIPVLWIEQHNRAVDARGVLLPVSARREGLPVFVGKSKPPTVRAGQVWDNPDIVSVARVAGGLYPDRKLLGLKNFRVSVEAGEVTFRREEQTVVWGRSPGDERPGEPGAVVKAERLLEAARTGQDMDLRK